MRASIASSSSSGALVGAAVAAAAHRHALYRSSTTSGRLRDHSTPIPAAEGLIDERTAQRHDLARGLTRAIGAKRSVDIDACMVDVRAGDRFLLCSDGLTAYVPTDQWLAAALTTGEVAALPASLVEHATSCAGRDDVTAVIAAVGHAATEVVSHPWSASAIGIQRAPGLAQGFR